ncbi:hypothetical protein [Leuconostoc citreum]
MDSKKIKLYAIICSALLILFVSFIVSSNIKTSEESVQNEYSSSESSLSYSSDDSSSSSIEESSSSSQQSSSSSNAMSYEEKVNSLLKGTAQKATYDKDTNTLTYVGFEPWSDTPDEHLQHAMDILETIANRQAVVYGMHNPEINVVLPNGELIANSDGKGDIDFVK